MAASVSVSLALSRASPLSLLSLSPSSLHWRRESSLCSLSSRSSQTPSLSSASRQTRRPSRHGAMASSSSSSSSSKQQDFREEEASASFSHAGGERQPWLLALESLKPSSSAGLAAAVPLSLLGSAFLVLPAMAAESSSYSQASYYTSLGLFIISVPGVWSLIKRSTKSKIVKKTFIVDGPGKPNSKPLNLIAGEITSFFTRNNYKVADRGEVVTFEGILTPNRSQAAFLVFCTLLSLASVALVLTITVPDVGDNWYWLMVFSPLSGIYYWTKASRKEEIKVKMVVADDEATADVIIQGDDAEVDRLRRELALMEKGMIYVKGLLE